MQHGEGLRAKDHPHAAPEPVARPACEQEGHQEPTEREAEDPGGEDEDLERHGWREDRGDGQGQDPPAAISFAGAGRPLATEAALEQRLPAAATEEPQDRAPRHRAEGGEGDGQPGHGRVGESGAHDQDVVDLRKAQEGGIEEGDRHQAQGAELRDQDPLDPRQHAVHTSSLLRARSARLSGRFQNRTWTPTVALKPEKSISFSKPGPLGAKSSPILAFARWYRPSATTAKSWVTRKRRPPVTWNPAFQPSERNESATIGLAGSPKSMKSPYSRQRQ